VNACRPLTLRERFDVFGAVRASCRYSLWQSGTLAMLLLVGMVAWTLGRLAGQGDGRPS